MADEEFLGSNSGLVQAVTFVKLSRKIAFMKSISMAFYLCFMEPPGHLPQMRSVNGSEAFLRGNWPATINFSSSECSYMRVLDVCVLSNSLSSLGSCEMQQTGLISHMNWAYPRAESSVMCWDSLTDILQMNWWVKTGLMYCRCVFPLLSFCRDGTKGEQVSQNGLPPDQESPRVSYRSQTYQNYKNFNSRWTSSDRPRSGLWNHTVICRLLAAFLLVSPWFVCLQHSRHCFSSPAIPAHSFKFYLIAITRTYTQQATFFLTVYHSNLILAALNIFSCTGTTLLCHALGCEFFIALIGFFS